MRTACVQETFYKDNEGKRYCVLHFPGKEKSADFERALQRKVRNKDFNFRGVWFSDDLVLPDLAFDLEVDFSQAVFNAKVDFANSIFHRAAHFSEATFCKGANFSNANFGPANFSESRFSGKLRFSDTSFSGETDFGRSIFDDKADFTCASFRKESRFSRSTFNAEANFRDAAFSANADFRGASFGAEATFSEASFDAAASFTSATFNGEADFFSATFGKADFSQATFNSDALFVSATFSKDADFMLATFSAQAHFGSATFKGKAYFCFATFSTAADFSATFGAAADFMSATFGARANFSNAAFSGDADFGSATFTAAADFNSAAFADHVRFAGAEKHHVFTDTSSLDLQFARIERPDHVSFHTLSLRPYWFVNVDAREFDFTNVDWDRRSVNEEIGSLEEKNVSAPHRLLAIAYRHLAVNAEENHRYAEASRFRYMAMDRYRRERWRGPGFWRLGWWYWLASGYGERTLQAFLVLLGIWLVAGLLYTQVGLARWEPKLASESDVVTAKRDEVGTPLPLPRALAYSAAVMTFQKPEPRPATTAAQTVVLLETILGPVQAALLALAIRRKFMR